MIVVIWRVNWEQKLDVGAVNQLHENLNIFIDSLYSLIDVNRLCIEHFVRNLGVEGRVMAEDDYLVSVVDVGLKKGLLFKRAAVD